MGTISYILLANREICRKFREKIRDYGAEPTWDIPGLGYLGVEIDKYDGTTKKSIENDDLVYSLTVDRTSTDIDKKITDTKNVEITPNWRHTLIRYSNKAKIGGHHLANPSAGGPTPSNSLSIGVIDSGIDTDNNSIGRVFTRTNFTKSNILDDTGHGTVVALQILRYSPSASLADYKVISREKLRESNVIKAIAQGLSDGVDVLNISLGFDHGRSHEKHCPLCNMVNIAHNMGTLVVAAAGNHGTKRESLPPAKCPACAYSALSVGAVDDAGQMKSYTGYADFYFYDDVDYLTR